MRAAGVLPWLVLGCLAVGMGALWWRRRREDAQRTVAWEALARGFMLGFDEGSRSIRGRYRLLRLEITASRALFGLGSWVTRVSAQYEGVVPEGLALEGSRGGLRASARTPETLGRWLDAQGRRELLPPLLVGGVHVSGHTLTVDTPGLLADPEALRTLLGQLAELAKLLSLR